MREPRSFQENSFYHLISRGNSQDIFLFLRDYKKFLFNLGKYAKKFDLNIVAFALMPNHVHLLVKQESQHTISKFMQSLMTSYATYFNLKHNRTGHLLQGRFKHVLVETDEYLVHVSRYIHLNPSSAGIVRKPEDYPWSSYKHFLGLDKLTFIDKKPILAYFSRKNPVGDYQDFVNSQIDYQREISIQKLFAE